MNDRRSRLLARGLVIVMCAGTLSAALLWALTIHTPFGGWKAYAEAGKASEESAPNENASPGAGESAEGEDLVITLSPEQVERAGVTVAVAGPGQLSISTELPGEVRLNADRLAHVSPRVAGVVVEVGKNLGDIVHAGDVMAVLNSRELAMAKAAYLAARARIQLAQVTYEREKGLWEDKISAEQDYLTAKQTLEEAGIELASAEQQLRALGLTTKEFKNSASSSEDSLTRYVVLAPIDGTVIEKRAVLGESVQADATMYVVADLSTVWVDFSVPAKELLSIHAGQDVSIAASGAETAATGTFSYLGPVVEQDTRASLARLVLPNDKGAWKPGQFVTGRVQCEAVNVPVLAPKTAIQTIGGEPYIFIRSEEGFEASPVTLGRAGDTQVEILHGLEQGQSYAVTSTFILKAELEKGEGEEE